MSNSAKTIRWKLPLLAAALLLSLLALTATHNVQAQSGAAQTVPHDWELTPSELGTGDSFRLLFVTSGIRDALPTNINVYNQHVQDAAAGGHQAIRVFSGEFRAVVCTSAVNAKTNTGTSATGGEPIYWLDGARVADDHADFYDDSWDSREARLEFGDRPPHSLTNIWTGCRSNGNGWSGSELGVTSINGNRYGSLDGNNSPLSQGGERFRDLTWQFYALSPVLTVGAVPGDSPQTPSVPDAPSPTFSGVTAMGFTVNWTVPADNGAAIDDYDLNYREAGETGWQGTSLGGATTLNITGLRANTEYEVRVRAHNSVGEGPWGTARVTTSPSGRPFVVDRVFLSSAASNTDTYIVGDTIEATVDFNKKVETVIGEAPLLLTLDVGGLPGHAPCREITSYGDAPPLLFTQFNCRYKVKEGDVDVDGVSIAANSLTLADGGVIQDADGNNAILTHDAVDDHYRHMVDGIIPMVYSFHFTSDPGEDRTYVMGDEIEVTVVFSEDVHIEGAFALDLDIGGNLRPAGFHKPISNTLTFRPSFLVLTWIVGEGEVDADGISIPENALKTRGGGEKGLSYVIRDWAGNTARLGHEAVGDDVSHRVDAVAPTVDSIEITSDPGENDSYGLGNEIEVTVTFSEEIIVEGSLRLDLDIGGVTRSAAYDPDIGGGDSTSLTLTYTVAVGDVDTDGVSIPANALRGSVVRDVAGNEASLGHSALDHDEEHMVNAPGGL